MAFETLEWDTLFAVLLALGLGAIIGLERERHRTEKMVLAGIRTYPLVSLSGFLAAELSVTLAVQSLVSVGAFVMGGFALMMYWVRQSHGTTGLTSPIALFSTYFVGVLVGVGRDFEAIAAGLAIALLLFTKERLHRLAEVLTPEELEGALYFLILSLILYPITPTEPVDPWGLFDLRNALLIVLLVSLISFLSFLAMRRWGSEFGLPFSGLLGGLVNSEAATVSLAQLHRQRPRLLQSVVTGILLADGTLFVRNLAVAAIADPSLDLARAMLIPMLWPSLVLLTWAFLQPGIPTKDTTQLRLKSPFAFRPAFTFAFWFAVVSVGVALVTQTNQLGEAGIYLAALGGFVSAAAVAASMGTFVAAGQVSVEVAATTAILASLLSALDKIPLARLGTIGVAHRLVAPITLAVATGAGLLLWAL